MHLPLDLFFVFDGVPFYFSIRLSFTYFQMGEMLWKPRENLESELCSHRIRAAHLYYGGALRVQHLVNHADID